MEEARWTCQVVEPDLDLVAVTVAWTPATEGVTGLPRFQGQLRRGDRPGEWQTPTSALLVFDFGIVDTVWQMSAMFRVVSLGLKVRDLLELRLMRAAGNPEDTMPGDALVQSVVIMALTPDMDQAVV